VSLSANAIKLSAMAFRSAVKRYTLADANELRDWRVWADLAAVLIRRARKLRSAPRIGAGSVRTILVPRNAKVRLPSTSKIERRLWGPVIF
jgi:hypothetical protein